MSAEVRWTVRYGPRSWSVCGFKKRKKGRTHARNHFLNPPERWGELRPRRQPRDYRQELESLEGEATLELYDEAVRDYVEVVRRNTASFEAIERVDEIPRRESGTVFQSVVIVSQAGIFSAFRKGEVSELCTSYRPRPRVAHGEPRPKHFRKAARRKLNGARP